MIFWSRLKVLRISIHALREESDLLLDVDRRCFHEFQSTPSARRATVDAFGFSRCHVISIHALREESDVEPLETVYGRSDFNPRPPRGERLTLPK